MMNRRLLCLVASVVMLSTIAFNAAASPSTPSVHLSQPASVVPAPDGVRGHPYITSAVDLASSGYVEQEFLVSGTARTYPTNGSEPTTAPYTTRVIVRRPANPQSFNHSVDVEWFNVTSQVDIDLDWGEAFRYLMREGYAYVGVSAQQAGVNTLKAWDPVRYGSLSHPGDSYALDIYTQVVASLRAGSLLGNNMHVAQVLASGHSQAGSELHTYIETVQPQTHAIDGFLLRGDAKRSFAAEPDVPVLHYMTETEATGVVVPATGTFRDDSNNYRLWQFAGPAHNDNWSNTYWLNTEMPRDWANAPVTFDQQAAGAYGEEGGVPVSNCSGNENGVPAAEGQLTKTNEFPQRYAVEAAFAALNNWVKTGRAPAIQPRLVFNADGTSLARDPNTGNNAVGGIRSPVVDVPIATYSGEGGCPLSGWMKPFDTVTLHARYPTHDDYVTAFTAAARRARDAGVLLPFDYDDLVARANAAPIPGPPLLPVS